MILEVNSSTINEDLVVLLSFSEIQALSSHFNFSDQLLHGQYRPIAGYLELIQVQLVRDS